MGSDKLKSKVCFKGTFVYKEREEEQLGRMGKLKLESVGSRDWAGKVGMTSVRN